MMIKVNGRPMEWQEGMTVKDVLDAMGFTFPMIVVKIDGVVVRREDFATKEVPDGAEVSAIHLISGG
ncbi:MAG: sulfur carrier protein ThiS [Thermoplasmata archaeon]|nr:sulfur carrier protein ThiS [Thermoplasmata archaeon]